MTKFASYLFPTHPLPIPSLTRPSSSVPWSPNSATIPVFHHSRSVKIGEKWQKREKECNVEIGDFEKQHTGNTNYPDSLVMEHHN